MKVDVIPVSKFNKRTDGLLIVDLADLPLPSDFLNQHQILIYFPPMQFGGNHKHPRREIFFSLNDDVELHWIDQNRTKHIRKMKKKIKFIYLMFSLLFRMRLLIYPKNRQLWF